MMYVMYYGQSDMCNMESSKWFCLRQQKFLIIFASYPFGFVSFFEWLIHVETFVIYDL
jgi:hypothetical protein